MLTIISPRQRTGQMAIGRHEVETRRRLPEVPHSSTSKHCRRFMLRYMPPRTANKGRRMRAGRQFESNAGPVAFLVILAAMVLAAGLTGIQPRSQPAPPAPRPTARNLDNLPLAFAPNTGQAAPAVRFMAHQRGGNLLFEQSEIDVIPAPHPASDRLTQSGLADAKPEIASAPFSITFEGANQADTILSGASLPGTASFMLGSAHDRWRANLPTFSDITYNSLYPGVDLRYSGTGTRLDSEYTLAPGADPGLIRSRYSAAALALVAAGKPAGALQIASPGSQSQLVAEAPSAWQDLGSLTLPVSVGYVVSADGSTGFKVGAYDKGRPLHLDSALVYATYLGGSGRDDAFPIAADSQGNAYVTGFTASLDYPLAQPLQPYYGGNNDVFISKINPTGSALVYSTYLGGSGLDEAWGIAVDANFNVYVTGVTSSTNFPTMNPVQPTYHGYEDAFVAKLNPAGSALVYSTYLGGAGYDVAQSITVSGDSAYVAGQTTSTDFPTMNPVQPSNHGNNDMFVARLSPSGGSLIFSTYLGGALDDEASGIIADAVGNAYVTGTSRSTDFPISSGNVFQPYNSGGSDAIVAKIGPQGSNLVYSTYIGGTGDDSSWGVVVSPSGDAIITGGSGSDDFPTRRAIQLIKSVGVDVFVTELSETGSWLVFSTFVGGNGDYDAPYGIANDAAGNLYVAGVTNSTDFPTLNAVQANNAGGDDIFMFELGRDGQPLIFSTYLGGSREELGWGAAVDPQGNMYASGSTRSFDFPTPNALQAHTAGNDDSAIAKLAPVTAPTSTPQPCSIAFSDVTVGSTFYPYVRCLACSAIVTGYSDGTFRPNSNVTRGQLAKIISNAADYVGRVGVQVFEDVPIGSAFFSQTAELSSRGIVSGYACGRPGEPCMPPLNRPYFDPNTNVTRAQAAKMVALTAAFPAPPANQQTFEDVPPSHPFYPWIEEMGSLGLLSGYPCGGPGEPCVPPQNRPYFRAANNMTRGQASKITANTFFLDCVQQQLGEQPH